MKSNPVSLYARRIQKGSFEPEAHWYPKALNATIHPMVHFFMNLDTARIIRRYCHLHPKVDYKSLEKILNTPLRYFKWAGADLIHVTTEHGNRKMVIIENNSCPSGQKSMPLLDDNLEQGGYRRLIENTFKPMMKNRRNLVDGALAVIYDKNPMEASGYAATIANVMDEPVYYAPFYANDLNPPVRFDEHKVMQIRLENGQWLPIRGAFRYVTQMPWNRIPPITKTRLLNPVLACLAGGRNKMVAAKAYDMFNGSMSETGLEIVIPQTMWNVRKAEIPLWLNKMGGQAVIKVPYSNAGQGVFTIVNKTELNAFMEIDFPYEQFVVQSLIGNYKWSSSSTRGKLYHVGTLPNQKGDSYVADIRMMVSTTETGIKPLCIYSRKARKPLVDDIQSNEDSWDILGTNLSLKSTDGNWNSDTNRLMLVDRRDFNKLGIGLDDLIDAYIQTVLSTIAIDQMAQNLISTKGKFKSRLFKSLNSDTQLLNEIIL